MKAGTLFYSVLAALLGILSVVVPYLATAGYNPYWLIPAPLFPLLATAREQLNPVATVLILITGSACLGYFNPERWWIPGPFTALPFPLAMFLEMQIDASSHKLLPFELALYVVLIAIPATVGAFTGYLTARFFSSRHTDQRR